MLSIFRNNKSEGRLARRSSDDVSSTSLDETPPNRESMPQEQIRRSGSVRLPNDVRLSQDGGKSQMAELAKVDAGSTPKRSATGKGRIDEESDTITGHGQDQISALPAVAQSPPGTGESTRTSLRSIRGSLKESRWASSAGFNALGRSLGSRRRNSGVGHGPNRELDREAETAGVASDIANDPSNDSKRPATRGSIFKIGKGSVVDAGAVAKVGKPKPPRAGLKGLFPRANEKDNGHDTGTVSSWHDHLWSPPRVKNADTSRRNHNRDARDTHAAIEETGEHFVGSQGKRSSYKLSNSLQLPDIITQPSLESEIRIDLLARQSQGDTDSTMTSGVSEISDQARAPSSRSLRDGYGLENPSNHQLGLLARRRSRNRNVPTRITEKSEAKGSYKAEGPLPLKTLDDPFRDDPSTAPPTTASLTETTVNESRLASPATALTAPSPTTSQPSKPQARDDTEGVEKPKLYDTIRDSLRGQENEEGGRRTRSSGRKQDAASSSQFLETESSDEPIEPLRIPKKRNNKKKKWKHAGRNFFPRWGFGMPQDEVIDRVTRGQEFSPVT